MTLETLAREDGTNIAAEARSIRLGNGYDRTAQQKGYTSEVFTSDLTVFNRIILTT